MILPKTKASTMLNALNVMAPSDVYSGHTPRRPGWPRSAESGMAGMEYPIGTSRRSFMRWSKVYFNPKAFW